MNYGPLKNCAKFTEKYLYLESQYSEVAAFQSATLSRATRCMLLKISCINNKSTQFISET